MRASCGGSSHGPCSLKLECCVVRLAVLGVGTGLLLQALAQCTKGPSCSLLPHLCTGTETPMHFAGVLHSVPQSSYRPPLCPQAVEERFCEPASNLSTPTPIGIEGSWQVPDATWAVHRPPYFACFVDSDSRRPCTCALNPWLQLAQACQDVMSMPQDLVLSASPVFFSLCKTRGVNPF